MAKRNGTTPGKKGPTVEHMVGKFPRYANPKIWQLFDYWKSIHPKKGLPGRQHFEPLDIPILLPNIFLADVIGSNEFKFRIIGTRLDEFFCGNFTGERVISAFKKGYDSQTYLDMCEIVQDGQLRWRKGLATFVENREHVTTERIFLPLAFDGATVDMILGFLLAKIGDSNFC